MVCAAAANGSNFEILKWLKEEQGFVWDARTILYASEAGCFEIVEYCLKNECPTHSAVSAAASASRFQMVRLLVSRGCQVDEDACLAAAATGDVQMLEYFKRMGGHVGIGCLRAARKNHRVEMIAWIKEQKKQ